MGTKGCFDFRILRCERERRQGHRGIVIWMTGLPGSGKTTLANAIEAELYRSGCQTIVLDGDVIRSGLSADLGYSAADRREQLRRVTEVSRLSLQGGGIVLASLITPEEEGRKWLRAQFLPQDFVLIYCKCSLETCMSRDPKGHYAKARTGAILDFTGVSSRFEVPQSVDLTVDTETRSIAACASDVVEFLRHRAVWQIDEGAQVPRHTLGCSGTTHT